MNRDDAGNSQGTASTPLAYNSYNQVASIDGRTQGYTDQGNDLRVATNTATGSRIGLVNTSLGIIARTTTSGVAYYVRAPGSGKILAEYQPGDAGSYYYYVTNNQGSVTTLINAAGDRAAYYRYTPYGQASIIEDDTNSAAAKNPFRYIGGYNDIEGDGYTKLGARYYDNHAHFTTTSPNRTRSQGL